MLMIICAFTALSIKHIYKDSCMYCLGHIGFRVIEQANRLASMTDITTDLLLGRTEVLRGLRNFLSMDRPDHHNMYPLIKRRTEAANVTPF